MGVVRAATEDTELGGCPVQEGDLVMVMLGSANTDEAEFGDADEVRFDREVNRHLAFGGGIHRCLGSHLARLELRVALREWHRRIPDYAVSEGHTLVYTPAIRSHRALPADLPDRRLTRPTVRGLAEIPPDLYPRHTSIAWAGRGDDGLGERSLALGRGVPRPRTRGPRGPRLGLPGTDIDLGRVVAVNLGVRRSTESCGPAGVDRDGEKARGRAPPCSRR